MEDLYNYIFIAAKFVDLHLNFLLSLCIFFITS